MNWWYHPVWIKSTWWERAYCMPLYPSLFIQIEQSYHWGQFQKTKRSLWYFLHGYFDSTPRTIWHYGQFDTIMESRTIWHHEGKEDNLTPRTIWHRGQFDTIKQNRTIWHIMQNRTIWHCENFSPTVLKKSSDWPTMYF